MDWNHLAQDRDQWWDLANTFGFYKILRNSEEAEQLVASQEGFSSMELVIASRPMPGPTCPPMKWVQGALSLEIKQMGREADDSPLHYQG
jgi:hypothetical protein